MTIAHLVNTCPACGAEESLDGLLMRMIDDDDVRRLIAQVIAKSLPLGGLVVRYLRLHKPPKQRLRMSRVHELLAELVTDIAAGCIKRKGRDWIAPVETWKLGFEAVFEAVDKGTLKAPLQGNGYLYEVLMRMADKAEADAERINEANRRGTRPATAEAPQPLDAVIADMDSAIGGARQAAEALASRMAPPGPSPYARKLRAQIEARKHQTQDTPEDERTEK